TSELPFLKEGLYVIQDEASQLVDSVFDPKPGERILDACAAPGGKTTHMAQKMENLGEIYALDVSKAKLDLLEGMSQRLGIKIAKTIKGDAARPLPIPREMKFDRILADVPCSGFGTLRRNPDLKWRRGQEDIQRLSELQFSILRNLGGYVKKGGVIVYSTCTVFHEENEDVVGRFLTEKPEFNIDRIDTIVSGKCRRFISDSFFKTFPPQDRMDGFFVARMIRSL
ncbi:MAG: RsmB/NOP family class I SAM-dependent RNA methyltransferase, partial [Thermodesulfobacteriota bacterium]